MHTPVEIGFWNEPRVLAFAEKFGCTNAPAAIVRLREFVILNGTHDGKLPGYSFDELVMVMRAAQWNRSRLLRALDEGRFLRRKRQTWYVPDWSQSPAGRYCAIRKWERDRKQEFREAKAAAALAQVETEATPGTGPGQDRDVPAASTGRMRSTNKSGPERTDPDAASGGGDGGALARWEWFKTLHPRLNHPDLCKRLLGSMDAENWDQLQYALPRHAEIYRGRSTRKVALASKYLKEGIFWELKRDTAVSPTATPKQSKAEKKANDAQIRRKKLQYLQNMLNDPELDEATKAQARSDLEKLTAEKAGT
jgi:hypothetical protein